MGCGGKETHMEINYTIFPWIIALLAYLFFCCRGGGGGVLNRGRALSSNVQSFKWKTVPKHHLIQRLLFHCTLCNSHILPEVRFCTYGADIRGLDLFVTKLLSLEGFIEEGRLFEKIYGIPSSDKLSSWWTLYNIIYGRNWILYIEVLQCQLKGMPNIANRNFRIYTFRVFPLYNTCHIFMI